MSDRIERLNEALKERYFVERQLGEGGMATVYLADDLRHERKVALKVLKPDLAAVVGAERFLTEIKTTANLQHPHVLPLFDSGEADGFLFYVMPYVEGESLREMLDREGQLPVSEAVRIAKDVAEALAHAHAQGVVHRDIKPANILMSAGRPLVADFGIALAVSAAGGGRLTETGLSLGTPYYMSPEQATADRDTDARSDIYSLACVLYEMLVGEPPFTGSSAQAVLGKIIAGEAAAPRQHRKSVPEHVEAAIFQGLERLPADRFRTAEAFAAALDDTGFTGTKARTSRTAARTTGFAWPGVATVLAVLLIVSLVSRPATTGDVSARLVVPVPDGHRMGMDFVPQLALSPDGRTLAYFSGGTLYVRDLDSFEARAVVDVSDGRGPFFSADGTEIGYNSQGALWRVRVDGGAISPLIERGMPTAIGHWTSDGRIVYVGEDFGIWEASEGGGDPVQLTTPVTEANEAHHQWPQRLPNGLLMYTVVGASLGWEDSYLVLEDTDTGVRDTLWAYGTYGRYTSTGHVVFARGDGTIMAAPLDLGRRELTTTPEPIITGVRLAEDAAGASFALADNGVLVYVAQPEEESKVLAWVDREGNVLEEIGDPLAAGQLDLSADGATAAVVLRSPNRDEIYTIDLSTGTATRETFALSESETPVWSPDGSRLAYTEQGTGQERFLLIKTIGSNEAPTPVFQSSAHFHVTSWSPDGRYIVMDNAFQNPGLDLIALGDSSEVIPGVRAAGTTFVGMFSPDGNWLAYTATQGNRSEVFVVAAPSMTGQRQVSRDGGELPRWSADGSELFFQTVEGPRELMSAAIRYEDGFEVQRVQRLFEIPRSRIQTDYDVHPDGRFLMILPNPEGVAREIRVILGFDKVLESLFQS